MVVCGLGFFFLGFHLGGFLTENENGSSYLAVMPSNYICHMLQLGPDTKSHGNNKMTRLGKALFQQIKCSEIAPECQ